MKRKIVHYILTTSLLFVFTFVLTSCDKNTTDNFADNYKIEDNKLFFGNYPQTNVKLVSKEGLSKITFDSSWIKYKYYIKSESSDFMYYKDVDIDNNGTYDYRGVYFRDYRVRSSSSDSSIPNYSYQDDNSFFTNNIYWFKYEPIEWDILTESNEKVLVVTSLILDSQDICPTFNTAFEHNGGTGYANNYELSNIRKFLNDDFYNTSFTDLQKSLIEKTKIDNSSLSTESRPNTYVCNNTNDNIFLLSYKEATTYGVRLAKGTDYAKSQGLNVLYNTGYSAWWLRSPYNNNYENSICHTNGDYSHSSSDNTSVGVRPACWIKL